MGDEKGGKIIRFSKGIYLEGKFGFQTFCLGFPSNIDEYLPLFIQTRISNPFLRIFSGFRTLPTASLLAANFTNHKIS